MIDLVQKAREMGLSESDIQVLMNHPSGGKVDLGVPEYSSSYKPQGSTFNLSDPALAAASVFLPGAQPQIDVSGGYKFTPDGPGKTAAGYGTSGARANVQGQVGTAMGKLNAFRQGYEKGVQPVVNAQTAAVGKGVRGASKLMGFSPSAAGNAGRMAMSALRHPILQKAMAYAPVVGTGLAVGDIVFGNESAANKGMDTLFATAGGFLGSAVPVIGTGLGIAAGKMVSDGAQWLFGDKMSPEQRRAEEMARSLYGGMG